MYCRRAYAGLIAAAATRAPTYAWGRVRLWTRSACTWAPHAPATVEAAASCATASSWHGQARPCPFPCGRARTRRPLLVVVAYIGRLRERRQGPRRVATIAPLGRSRNARGPLRRQRRRLQGTSRDYSQRGWRPTGPASRCAGPRHPQARRRHARTVARVCCKKCWVSNWNGTFQLGAPGQWTCPAFELVMIPSCLAEIFVEVQLNKSAGR